MAFKILKWILKLVVLIVGCFLALQLVAFVVFYGIPASGSVSIVCLIIGIVLAVLVFRVIHSPSRSAKDPFWTFVFALLAAWIAIWIPFALLSFVAPTFHIQESTVDF